MYAPTVAGATNHHDGTIHFIERVDCFAVCADGSQVLAGQDCTTTCPDGSVVAVGEQCPPIIAVPVFPVCAPAQQIPTGGCCPPNERPVQSPSNPNNYICVRPEG